jgi:hypothetical protein
MKIVSIEEEKLDPPRLFGVNRWFYVLECGHKIIVDTPLFGRPGRRAPENMHCPQCEAIESMQLEDSPAGKHARRARLARARRSSRLRG